MLVGDTSYRGNGIGTKIAEKALTVVFEDLGMHRVELVVFDFNSPAIRLYTKLGFVEEGRLRDARAMGDEF